MAAGDLRAEEGAEGAVGAGDVHGEAGGGAGLQGAAQLL